ncbi:MAG TPA: lysylphosphatidylglycerol synthase domain-containing protein [Vicinamibacteria bacterium]|nr:lysylphosphatidylglycerol synthase domain-containing protein [Vicinamibacteria bacterium]
MVRRLLRRLARLLPAAAALALVVWWALRAVDVGRALDLVHAQGWRLPLLLLPNGLVMLAETAGWRCSFDRIAPRPLFRRLLGVRAASEGLMLGLPWGSVVNDSMQPYLLHARCGVPLPAAVAAAVARKFFVVVSHGCFLTVATLLCWSTLDQVSKEARRGLPWLLLAAGIGMVAFSVGAAAVTSQGRVAARLHGLLDRLGQRWLGSWLARHAGGFGEADAALRGFFAERPAGLLPPLLLYLSGWMVRSLETLLFLRLVGVELSLATAMVMEPAMILLRSVAAPVPAGIGVQDLGYVLFLKALGVPDWKTLGTAFVLLKRGKDLFWALAGLALLALGRWRRARPAAPPLPEGTSQAA